MSHGPLSFWDAIPAGFHSQVLWGLLFLEPVPPAWEPCVGL